MRLVLGIATGLAALIGLLVLAAALGLGWLVLDGRKARATGADYIALGSSFAAGPGVGAPARDAPKLCVQSAENFAHLLARKRGLRLLDRSCSGSTTADILTRGQFFQTPQIEAVTADARLVTVTTGGNDLGYVGGLMLASCGQRPNVVPWWIRSVCKDRPSATTDAKLQTLARSMTTIAREVRRRAPQATLVFVDYTTILPGTGACPARLPLTEAELTRYRAMARDLAAVTERVASENGAVLIRASDLTRGHDVCAVDPWVFGWAFPDRLLGPGPMAYHPTEKAMAVIARRLDSVLPPT
jgi:lysophospholipase L1-like esterase